MSALSFTIASAIVANALEGKYENISQSEFDVVVAEGWRSASIATTEMELLALLRPTSDLKTDILNHIVVLHLIEKVWRHQTGWKNPIFRIHQAIFGTREGSAEMRETAYVADYGAVVPTDLADLQGALGELERMIERIMPCFDSQPVAIQAVFLAHVFSSIVRIHPFRDGNGRTARMAVQYCLRCWDRPYLPLPKVRNEPVWREALQHAVDGDQELLVKELLARMQLSDVA